MVFNKLGIKSRNIWLMYLKCVLGGLLFFLPIIALYLEKDLFSITNVAIIFAVEAVAMMVLEIPTGAAGDLFGRKRTLILANVSVLIGLIFLYIGGSMGMFILFAIFNALGRSLNSGTDSALIYDTLKEEKKEHHYKKVVGNYYALWPLGAAIGSLVGGYLASISLSLPVLFTFIPIFLVLILTFFLKEPRYEREEHKKVLKHMFSSSKLVVKNSQLVIIFIAAFLIWGLGESVHQLNSIFFNFKEIPIIYFGVISAFIFGFSSAGHYFSHYVSEKIGDKKTLVLASLGSPLLILTATFLTKYAAAVVWVIPSIFFGLRNPVVNHLINLEVSSSKRATILSIHSFMIRMGIMIFAPIVGYLADLYTINTAFKISAAIMFTVPVVYMFLKEKK